MVGAEWRRLVKRRLARWLLVVLVLALGGVAAGVWQSSTHVPASFVDDLEAQAEERYQEALRDFHANIDDEIAACERGVPPGSGSASERDRPAGPDKDEPPAGPDADAERDPRTGPDAAGEYPDDFDCDRLAEREPERSDFGFNTGAFEFRDEFGDMLVVLAALLALCAFLVGASFIGLEWRAGGMTTLLLWCPQRLRVLAAKLAALLGGVTVVWALLSAAWTGALWWTAATRGITSMTTGAWLSFGLAEVRGLVLALVAATAGFALASLGRHTAVALGVALGAAVVGVGALQVLLHAVRAPYIDAWLWPTYPLAWLQSSVEVRDSRHCEGVRGPCPPDVLEITWQHAGVGMGVVLLALVAVAAWHMRHRDIA